VEETRRRGVAGTFKEDLMSQGGYVTLVGFVAQEPSIRSTPTGKVVTKVRVGATPRYKDTNGQWRDAETSYYDVSCWNRLAHHVRGSLHKGDPVVLKGRFRTSSFEDKNGNMRTSIEITADTVGHDLNRGTATYLRPQVHRVAPEYGREDERGMASAGAPGRPGDIDGAGGGEPEDIMDDEAIERFGREIDEADLAVRELRGNVTDAPDGEALDDEDGTDAASDAAPASGASDDSAVGTVPPVPATSY
jgi:single-strand DNA-binding protein